MGRPRITTKLLTYSRELKNVQELKTRLPFLTALFTLIVGTAVAGIQDTSPVPPLPADQRLWLADVGSLATSKNGEVAWITNGGDVPVSFPQPGKLCYPIPVVKRLWNPTTGAHSITPLGLKGLVTAQVATPSGTMFLVSSECDGENGRVALLTTDGKIAVATTPRSIFHARMVVLTDNSVAVVTVTGDDDSEKERNSNETKRHFRVFVVRVLGSGLSVERTPGLHIPSRNNYAVAAITDGRMMVLGGSDGQYRGCGSCRANTYIFDPKTKAWSAGPAMLEPRSEHSATRLPDGSVLVTGGWTPTEDWGKGPSRSAERWDPRTNRFEAIAPMPAGTARHRGIWMPGQEGKTLLIAAGVSSSVHAYDVGTGSWKTVGSLREGSEEGGCVFVPFLLAGNAYAWAGNRTEGFYSSKECGEQQYWELATLRLATDASSPTTPPLSPLEASLVTYRGGAAFVPTAGGKPALMIGGTTHAGMNSYLLTAAVAAIGHDGHIGAMPVLNEARSNATAFRIGNGVLVSGGWGGDQNDRQEERPMLPMEWLATNGPDDKLRWLKVASPDLSRSSVLGQLADGSLLEVDAQGKTAQLKLIFRSGGVPAVERSEFPRLNRLRQSSGNGYGVRIRGLTDGRILVAGGDVQADKIALLKPDSNSSDASDEYVGIGPYLPSRRHETYDPASKRWRTSAACQGAGGHAAILDDGRVVKVGLLSGEETSHPRYVLEISNSDGTAWSVFPAEASPKMMLSDKARPFVVDGELFLSGEIESLSTGGGPSGVEWFNTATRQWEVLWRAEPKDNWRDHLGRVIVRQLTNGKVIVLPVDGF